MKGAIAIEKTQQLIGGLLLMAIVLAVVVVSMNPLESPEVRALELANMVAADLNSLSAQKGVTGSVEIERGGEFDVSVSFEDGKGHYVVVEAYKGEEKIGGKKVFILGYPKEKGSGFEKSLVKVEKVCISKERDDIAKVVEC